AVRRLADQIRDELNVKAVRIAGDEVGLVSYEIKPNLPVLGPRLGREVGAMTKALREADPAQIAAAVRAGQSVDGGGHTLAPGDLLITTRDLPGFTVEQEQDYTVALTTVVTPELADEGLAREIVHRIQTMRRDAGFEIADRIITFYEG